MVGSVSSLTADEPAERFRQRLRKWEEAKHWALQGEKAGPPKPPPPKDFGIEDTPLAPTAPASPHRAGDVAAPPPPPPQDEGAGGQRWR
eukprot:Skav219504  [mRNA]  locus=scaffold5760:24221:28021:- [translate_table: standard]